MDVYAANASRFLFLLRDFLIWNCDRVAGLLSHDGVVLSSRGSGLGSFSASGSVKPLTLAVFAGWHEGCSCLGACVNWLNSGAHPNQHRWKRGSPTFPIQWFEHQEEESAQLFLLFFVVRFSCQTNCRRDKNTPRCVSPEAALCSSYFWFLPEGGSDGYRNSLPVL